MTQAQTAYCNAADVYRLGFATPGMLTVPARLVASVSTTANTITLAGHGLATDDPISFRAESGGSLPAPLVAGTTYYAIVASNQDSFQVATAPAGAAIDITTTGSNVLAVPQMPWALWIAECSAAAEQTVVAHVVPLLDGNGDVPIPVREYVALMVTIRALAFCGRETAAAQQLLAEYTKRADRWGRGVPLRGVERPTSINVAITRSAAQVDPRGWDRVGGRFP